MKPVYYTVKKIDSIATGNNARIERVVLRIPQWQVAEKMNLSTGFLSNLERGTKKWTERHVKLFNKAIKDIKND